MERYTEDVLMDDMILCLRELDSKAQPNTCRVLAKLVTDYADAQATIAALQAQVKELEDDRSAWKEIAQDWSAAAKLAEQPEKFYEGYSAAVMNAMQALLTKARAEFTQRTAELEAAKAIQAIDLKNNNAYREQVANLHAELERVKGELVEATHNANVYQSLYSTSCMDRALLENELRDLRTLILALPKAEGEIVVNGRTIDEQYPTLSWQIASTGMDEFTNAIAALLQHRQGMEG